MGGCGKKVPFYIRLPQEPCFAFAGLYDTWHNLEGRVLSTYTIVTCGPNSTMAALHNRMPVIHSRENELKWVSDSPLSADDLQHILVPRPAGAMEIVRVSPLVNSPAVDDERVIRPEHSSQQTING